MEKLKKSFLNFEANIKSKKDAILKPFFALMVKIGVTPFLLSVVALVFGLGAAYQLAMANYTGYFVLIILSIIFDILDGGLARFKGAEKVGFWIDFFFDRAVMLVMMIVAYFTRENGSIFYLLAPIIYTVETVIYAFILDRAVNVTVRTPYLITVAFSSFAASILAVITDVLNLVGFVIYFIFKSTFKHESTDSSSRA